MVQSDKANLPTPSEFPPRKLALAAKPFQTHGTIGVAIYLCSLIFDLDKEKMEDLSKYFLFNKGFHGIFGPNLLGGWRNVSPSILKADLEKSKNKNKFHQTQQVVLELSIQRESLLEIELQCLNSKLSPKDVERATIERYTLEQIKEVIDDIDVKILEAQELEVVARNNLPPFPRLSFISLRSFSNEEEVGYTEPTNPTLYILPSSSSAPLSNFSK
ncbi:hypothetical protein HAX54_004001 [Datura stramonium]|uniref:Uncharacterized protein n=1 Tax=Datura stramonium TaxID=4076 RepID=A0ABS8T7I0_DATST|nr:hypothetical protein [Datura stramonium]